MRTERFGFIRVIRIKQSVAAGAQERVAAGTQELAAAGGGKPSSCPA